MGNIFEGGGGTARQSRQQVFIAFKTKRVLTATHHRQGNKHTHPYQRHSRPSASCQAQESEIPEMCQ